MAKSRKPKQTKRYLDAFDPRYADSVARKQSLPATEWPTYRPTDIMSCEELETAIRKIGK